MYLHVGNNRNIRIKSVIGIFDMDNSTISTVTRKYLNQKQKELMLEQFMQGIQVLSTALQAGLSMENAWREVQKELELLYGKDSLFLGEVREMNRSVALNHTIESSFALFAQGAEIEEISQFSEILSYYETLQSEQFIELFNNGAESVQLDGCSLKYKNKFECLL